MAGDERQLRHEVLDAARGETPRTDFWTKGQGLDSYFSGQGSQNIWLLRFATQALMGMQVPWEAVYHYQLGPPPGSCLVARGGSVQVTTESADGERVYAPGFGGSEFLSTIYWSWHLMSHLALTRAKGPIAERARRWVALNWALFRAIEAPDGSLMLFGQRSAGHNPKPRAVDWIYALASDGDVQRAEKWCKKAGAGLRQSWDFEIANELKNEMRQTWQESLSIPAEDLPKLLPLRVPTDIVRTTEGIAVVHARTCNSNTPPILVGTLWQDGRREILPTSDFEGERIPGGIRIRQKFDHATARIEGREIVYASSLYTGGVEQRIHLPDGDVISHLKLGRTEPVISDPAVPDPVVPDPVVPDPVVPDPVIPDPVIPEPEDPVDPPGDDEVRDLGRATALIAGLLLRKVEQPIQAEIVALLQSLPGDVDPTALTAIAARVRAFGIGPGQRQAVDWKEAIAILES